MKLERWECPEHGFDDATLGAVNPPRCGCGREFVWTRYMCGPVDRTLTLAQRSLD